LNQPGPCQSAYLTDIAGQSCLRELTQSLSVRHLMTPACELVGVRGDAPLHHALAVMDMDPQYDQLPVLGTDGQSIIGLVTRDALDAAGEASQVRLVMTPLSASTTLRWDATIPQAMDALASQRAMLVQGPQADQIVGLLHYADFNRHPSRVFFYLWLSALEIGLMRLLTNHIQQHELEMYDWLRHLPEQRQVNILGRYEVSRRQQVDLTPLEGAELTDLLVICRNVDELRLQLGHRTRSAFDQATSHLIPLRNAAMHPVRSMLASHADLPRLRNRFNNLEAFVLQLESLLKDQQRKA
jgi:hypothetical protein